MARLTSRWSTWKGRAFRTSFLRRASQTERVLRYGIQIADGLDHAHRQSVNHRDLKTENVVITPDGRAKILDFGLARRLEPQQLKELSESHDAIGAGNPEALAGTLSTMAPELLRGEQADERSDIWALGVLLYEMAAGSRPFTGATGFQVSGAILHQPPAPLPAGVPASLQAVIRRCLEKNPPERYRNAGEIRSALEAVQSSAGKKGFGPRRAAVAALGVLLAAVVAAAVLWPRVQPAEASLAIGPSGRPAIAVMHFENVIGAEETAWMSRGVPNMLLTGLAQTRGLDIVSPQRLHEVIRQTGRDSLESLDQSQFADVARRAGAGAIVRGSIVRAGSEIRIDAQLEDLSSGRVLAADSVRGTDVFALVDQLAARIRNSVGFRDSRNDPARRRSLDLLARGLSLLLRGRDGIQQHPIVGCQRLAREGRLDRSDLRPGVLPSRSHLYSDRNAAATRSGTLPRPPNTPIGSTNGSNCC